MLAANALVSRLVRGRGEQPCRALQSSNGMRATSRGAGSRATVMRKKRRADNAIRSRIAALETYPD